MRWFVNGETSIGTSGFDAYHSGYMPDSENGIVDFSIPNYIGWIKKANIV